MFMQMKAFEIIGFAGDAMSLIMQALDELADNKFDEANQRIQEAKLEINKAHQVQTDLLMKGFKEDSVQEPVSLIMVHAQDHLMNAMLAIQLVEKLIKIQKKNS